MLTVYANPDCPQVASNSTLTWETVDLETAPGVTIPVGSSFAILAISYSGSPNIQCGVRAVGDTTGDLLSSGASRAVATMILVQLDNTSNVEFYRGSTDAQLQVVAIGSQINWLSEWNTVANTGSGTWSTVSAGNLPENAAFAVVDHGISTSWVRPVGSSYDPPNRLNSFVNNVFIVKLDGSGNFQIHDKGVTANTYVRGWIAAKDFIWLDNFETYTTSNNTDIQTAFTNINSEIVLGYANVRHTVDAIRYNLTLDNSYRSAVLNIERSGATYLLVSNDSTHKVRFNLGGTYPFYNFGGFVNSPPEFGFSVAPTVTTRTVNSYTLNGTLDESGNVYAVATLTTDVTDPTPEQIVAGLAGDGNPARGTGSATGVTAFEVTVTGAGLSANPAHDLHVVGRKVAS